MALTIEQLELQIVAEAQSADKEIDTFIGRLEKLETKLNGLGSAGKSAASGLKEISNSATQGEKGIKGFVVQLANGEKPIQNFTDKISRQISKFHTLYGAFKSVANAMGSWFNESNEYIETINLFNVTMGEAAPAAREYAQSVEKALGIDSKDFMQYQGIFQNLATGFGVSAEQATVMSRNLTQLSYDMASFFNASSVEESFDKLSSAMSGQVKGLREYGIDTTVASLQEYALSKGIQTKVRSMSQAEKSLLRYNYIMEKSINMQGDMARTIITPANSMRILTEQINRMKRALGNIISVVVAKFIPYIQAVVEIVTDAANAIAKFFGFSEKDFEANTKGLVGGFEEENEEANKLQDNIKEIRKQLMGFDELNILSSPDTDSGGSDDANSKPFDMDVYEYDFLKGLKTDKLDEIKEKMKDILGYIPLIATGFGAWKLTSFIADLIFANTKAQTLKEALALLGKKLTLTAGVTLAITGIVLETKGIISAIQDGLNGINFTEILGGGGMIVAGGALIGQFFGSALLGSAFAAVIAGIPMYFTGIYDAIVNGLNWLNGLLIPLGATLAGAGIGAIIGMLGGPIGAGVGTLIGIAVGLLTDFAIGLWQHFDKIEQWFNNLPTIAQVGVGGAAVVMSGIIIGLFGPVGTLIVAITAVIVAMKTEFFGVITWVREHIINPLKTAATWWKTNVTDPIVGSLKEVFQYAKDKYTELKNGMIEAVTPIIDKIVEISNKIKEIYTALKWAFFEYLWNPMTAPIVKFYDDKIKPIVDKVKNAFTSIANWFKEKVYNQILKQVETMKLRIEILGKGVVDAIAGTFKFVMNGLFKQIEDFINGFIYALNAAIVLINKIPGVNIKPVEFLAIPRLAEGGIVSEGQMFIAREAGPELVGNIGRKTAVANNDQIVSGIESGVYRAMVAANATKGGSQTIRIINEIDGDIVGEKVIKYHNGKVMQTGVSPLLV